MRLKVGDSVTDPLSKFEGVVTSRTEYLFGCVRVCVEARETKDGKPVEAYFDEQRLDLQKDSKVAAQRRARWDANRDAGFANPGGPGDVPPPRRMPPPRD